MAKLSVASLIKEIAELKDTLDQLEKRLDHCIREYALANARAELSMKNEKKLADDLTVANGRVVNLQERLESSEKRNEVLRKEVLVAEAGFDDLIDKLLDRVNRM